jgi:GNAT superfamily N-acetyltransferase
MIRPVTPADTPELLAMAAATGVFRPLEVDALREVLDDYHDHAQADGDRCFAYEGDGKMLGFEYHGPEPMTINCWSLWWIVVRPGTQGKGIGASLLKFAEDDARARGARIIFLDTSGMPHSELTRKFYKKHGYEEEARLRDFYAPGDDQVIFRKVL